MSKELKPWGLPGEWYQLETYGKPQHSCLKCGHHTPPTLILWQRKTKGRELYQNLCGKHFKECVLKE